MRFDVDRYCSVVGRLDDRDIQYSSFQTQPLDPDTLRTLRYMHDVESHTVCYQRDLLVTRAHDDPALTTFLTMWAFEEHWHGVALSKVLAAHGVVAGRDRVARVRRRRVLRDRFGTMTSALASLATPHVTAVHMAWGAVNEWTTQAGYLQLARRANHPVLSELLRRLARQEGRHIDFYASEADRRLQDPKAQRLTRWALARWWRPVGSGVLPAAETDHVIRHLFGGSDGLAIAARIDDRLARLPGLEGLRIVTKVVLERATLASGVTSEHHSCASC